MPVITTDSDHEEVNLLISKPQGLESKYNCITNNLKETFESILSLNQRNKITLNAVKRRRQQPSIGEQLFDENSTTINPDINISILSQKRLTPLKNQTNSILNSSSCGGTRHIKKKLSLSAVQIGTSSNQNRSIVSIFKCPHSTQSEQAKLTLKRRTRKRTLLRDYFDSTFGEREEKRRKLVLDSNVRDPISENINEIEMSVYDYHHQQQHHHHHAEMEGQPTNGSYNISNSSSVNPVVNTVGGKHTNLVATVENMKLSHPPPATNYNLTMATLCNIGNTCYLNSVVYTLRFAPVFLHNLHHLVEDLNQIGGGGKSGMQNNNRQKSSSLGRNIGGLVGQSARSWSSKDLTILGGGTNGVSTTGSQPGGMVAGDIPKTKRQIATEKLHELYHNLHRNEIIENTDPFHADTFLHAIQDVSSIFEGNQQQDAHEFLMCILDSIRETCQSLIKIASETSDTTINGYSSVSEQPEIILPPPPIKTSFFSRKSKKKGEKIKSSAKQMPESPSKDISRDTSTQSHHDQIQSTIKNGILHGIGGSTTLVQLNEVDELNPNGVIGEITTSPSTTVQPIDADKIKENIKKLGYNFFTDDFEGITVSTTKCLSCETITEQKETMIDIAVPISGYENMETMDKPHLFFQNSCITKEYFRGDNKYRCEQCFGYTEAIRSISFEVLPRLLIIQLKRFSGGMEKINSFIPTPLQLNCFCAKCWMLPDGEKRHTYRLYSVITHVGATMSVGHYIAYTSSLNLCTEYINCSKESLKNQQQNNGQQQVNGGDDGSMSAGNDNRPPPAEKNSGLIKKIIFPRNKASSSGDVTKNVKNNLMSKFVNGGDKFLASVGSGFGVGDKLAAVTNHGSTTAGSGSGTGGAGGGSGAQQPTMCQGLKCCSIRGESILLRNSSNLGLTDTTMSTAPYDGLGSGNNLNNHQHHQHNNHFQQNNNQNSSSSSSTSSSRHAGGGGGGVEPVWYMCDDDKIRAMSQSEFEDLLSPNNKVTITPYLLFYARTNND